MNTQKYSLWDTLPELRRLHDVLGFSIDAARKRRCEDRIYEYELAADARGELDLKYLAMDLASRRTAWEGDLDAPLMPIPDNLNSRITDPERAWFLFALDVFAIFIYAWFVLYSLFLLLLLPLWAIVMLMRRSRRNRCRRALTNRRCPDCGYDLSTSDAFPPAQMLNLHVSPRACTECGVPWPLVPPNRHVVSVWTRLRKPRSHAT